MTVRSTPSPAAVPAHEITKEGVYENAAGNCFLVVLRRPGDGEMVYLLSTDWAKRLTPTTASNLMENYFPSSRTLTITISNENA